jgi:L-fuconolactonase
MRDELYLIDTHVHPISKDKDLYPLRSTQTTEPQQDSLRRPGEGGMVEKGMNTEETLSVMKPAGVQRLVLVQSASLYGYDNSYIADSAARHPDHCISLCAIDMLADDAPDVLSYWIEQRKMRGVRITTADSLDDPKSFAVWERARALRVPVDVQMQPRHFEKLRVPLNRFPDVPVLIDHAANANRHASDGTPAPAEPPHWLLSLAEFQNCYLKLTSQNIDGVLEVTDSAEVFFGPIREAFGARRLMWGSDWPATADQPYADRLYQAQEAFGFMSIVDQQFVLGGTAGLLWPELKITV